MDSKKEIQHVYLVGAKSLGAYGGYETFVYKLTEYHQNGMNKESMAYKIYDSCKSERELYIVSGSEHTDCYRSNPEKYESIVSEFLKKHIPTN